MGIYTAAENDRRSNTRKTLMAAARFVYLRAQAQASSRSSDSSGGVQSSFFSSLPYLRRVPAEVISWCILT
ncbi:hypothetical protein F2Q70_00035103 [Brassica cretica]|uniref:Uncharacterized protein n=1 Tax=Brassica cretica TaxID=69181 RepID=A0A8S9JTI1_BRACR|nr:hypothetical protein F2Q70_00035103 [Brassica cretica]